MKRLAIVILLVFTYLRQDLFAQAGELGHRGEIWAGLIYPVKLGPGTGIWNDFHFVANSFWVSRHGFSWQATERANLTAGYAMVYTATAFSNRLARQEHRPWGQVELVQPLGQRFSYRFRIRYDYRVRKKIEGQELLDGYVKYSRIRFLNGARFPIMYLGNTKPLHLNLMNEILLNFGKESPLNRLDQNRIWALFGYEVGKITIMPGYEMRYLPSRDRNYLHHGFAIWAVANLNFSGIGRENTF